MRILITDDEAPARGELRYMLESLETSATFAEAKHGEEALASLAHDHFDVIFLDINMPGMNGLSVASTLLEHPDPPMVVFATAYDEHAVKAFELAALDYVVKPFDEKRLAQTVKRIRQTMQNNLERQKQQQGMRDYLQTNKIKTLKKLWVERDNENRLLLDFADIYWLEASEKKVYAYTAKEQCLIRYTLKELESLLGDNFARVHKAHIVNLNHIAEVVPWFSGNYLIRMDNPEKSEITMSRRYAAQLKAMTDWR